MGREVRNRSLRHEKMREGAPGELPWQVSISKSTIAGPSPAPAPTKAIMGPAGNFSKGCDYGSSSSKR